MPLIEFKRHRAADSSLCLQELRTSTMRVYQDNRDCSRGRKRQLPENRRVTATPTSDATEPFHTILNHDPVVNRTRTLKNKISSWQQVRTYVRTVPKHTEYISLVILKCKSQDRCDPDAKAKTSSYLLWTPNTITWFCFVHLQGYVEGKIQLHDHKG